MSINFMTITHIDVKNRIKLRKQSNCIAFVNLVTVGHFVINDDYTAL